MFLAACQAEFKQNCCLHAGLENNQGPTILLVHGFGASAYHWRSNIPALVQAGYRVFAVDLLGEAATSPFSHISLSCQVHHHRLCLGGLV